MPELSAILVAFIGLACLATVVAIPTVVAYLVGYNRGGAAATDDMNRALATFDAERLTHNASQIKEYSTGPESVFGMPGPTDISNHEVPGPEDLFRHPKDAGPRGGK